MKAGPIWDFDWAWKNIWGCFTSEMTDGSQWAHHVNDCPTDNYGHGWYIRFLQDSTFTQELKCTYEEYRASIFDTNYIFAYIDSMGQVVADAKERHFKKWPILGISGPAPKVLAVATTYEAELDTLKSWIAKRLNWLDENIPGLCEITNIQDLNISDDSFSLYPNPGTGQVYYKSKNENNAITLLEVFDSSGNLCLNFSPDQDKNEFSFTLPPGIYFVKIYSSAGNGVTKKLIVIPR